MIHNHFNKAFRCRSCGDSPVLACGLDGLECPKCKNLWKTLVTKHLTDDRDSWNTEEREAVEKIERWMNGLEG